MTAAPAPERTKERWVYTGRRWNGSALFAEFLPSGGHEERQYPTKGGWSSGFAIGGVYEVSVSGTSITIRGEDAPKFVEKLDDRDEDVARWEATDRAAYVASRRASVERVAKRSTVLETTLTRLNRAYRKQPFPSRAAFLAYVIERVTRLP